MIVAASLVVAMSLIIAGLRWRLLRRRDSSSELGGLGDLSGRSLAEVVALIGPPTSRSQLPRGNELVQWRVAQDRFAILFDQDGKFIRMTREHASTDHP